MDGYSVDFNSSRTLTEPYSMISESLVVPCAVVFARIELTSFEYVDCTSRRPFGLFDLPYNSIMLG